MKLLLERWRQFIDEQTEPAQRRYRKLRIRAKAAYLDTGANKYKEKGHTPRKRGTTVSAPPAPLEEGKERDTILVIFGPTGSGKSTYKKHFIKKKGWDEIRTHTTRKQRAVEDDEYVFYEGDKGMQEWLRRDKDNEFINTNEYEGNYYGTDKKEFLESGEARKRIMLSDITSVDELRDIGDRHGKRMIFLHASGMPAWAPTPEAMKASMEKRGTPERFEVWSKEMGKEVDIPYSYLVTDIEEADTIVSSEMAK